MPVNVIVVWTAYGRDAGLMAVTVWAGTVTAMTTPAPRVYEPPDVDDQQSWLPVEPAPAAVVSNVTLSVADVSVVALAS